MAMNVLIAGAAGLIGSNLSERLLKEGHAVVGVDNLLTGERGNADDLSKTYPSFTFYEGGVETPEFMDYVKGLGVKFDRVYDLACPTGVPNLETLGEEMLLACSDGTRNLLKIAQADGAKFLITSSSEVYGDPLVAPQGEDYTGNVDPIGPRANYEEGKRFAETWAKLYATKYGVDAKIVRLFNTYGRRMPLEDRRVMTRFVSQALSGAPLTLHGEGSQIRTLCFIDDTLDGIVLVMEKGVAGEAYNIGGTEQITMKQLAEMVIKATNSASEISYVERPYHDHQSRLPLVEKLEALGWKQKVSLADGIAATVADIRARLTPSAAV